MARRPRGSDSRPGRAPRASGDGPTVLRLAFRLRRCSPRERGWPHHRPLRLVRVLVLPARAGMAPASVTRGSPIRRAPRASGDGPLGLYAWWKQSTCSPRERGWPLVADGGDQVVRVLPARAGMAPSSTARTSTARSAPRASGDGPRRGAHRGRPRRCSPRERGWPVDAGVHRQWDRVLPARAGMARSRRRSRRSCRRAPRASGDGPSRASGLDCSGLCFPRERGWPLVALREHPQHAVLPARAGMARSRRRSRRSCRRAPRASGDGPSRASGLDCSGLCFPRERGWPR